MFYYASEQFRDPGYIRLKEKRADSISARLFYPLFYPLLGE